ncbi:MAG TPA: hypothetical protein VFH65_24665 [Mycobacterium sp.]|nr:hypothetical protein [Mycobacterium sp.]
MNEDIESQILVIAVPGGQVTADGIAPLRALIVPQLRMGGHEPDLESDPGKPLSDFGFEDWPDVVRNATFTVQIAPNRDSVRHSTPLAPSAGASSDVWRAFFSGGVTVRKSRNVNYGQLNVTETTEDARRIARNYTASAGAYSGDHVDPTAVARIVEDQYAQWQELPESSAPPRATHGSSAPENWPAPDFQRIVSTLRAHPAVLIRLGLILEFKVPTSVIPIVSSGDAALIRIGCTFGSQVPSDVDIVTPWTRFEFDRTRFLPAPAEGSDVTRGIVDLAGAEKIAVEPTGGASDRWSLVTFDVDGAVGRLRDGAQKMGADSGGHRGASVDPGPVTPPVLHSAGIALLRNRRKEVMTDRLANNAGEAHERELTADDLTSGYCVDVREEAGEWTPLCERNATYTCKLDGVDVDIANPVVEEGPVKANAAVIGTDAVLRADEMIVRWNGWNLAIPRPTFDQHGARRRETARGNTLPFHFDFHFDQTDRPQVPLRFGKGYFLRVRIADMAGGGLKCGELGQNEGSSRLVQFRRHEPVPPPEFAPVPGMFTVDATNGELKPNPNALGAGGSIDRLIIRSDPMGDTPMDVEQFAAQYPPNQSRILLPPPASMVLAEQHGVLDGADRATWALVQRAIGPPGADENGSYNWLPDPAATGVQAFVRPGADSPAPSRQARSPWAPRWPLPLAMGLELRQRESPGDTIEWLTVGTRSTLMVWLEPGLQADIELSSTLDSEELDKFEIKTWAASVADSQIAEGRHPMATPPRVVEFVHAVRRPMNPPHTRLVPAREEGELFAVLADGNPDNGHEHKLFGIHRASTGQVDVSAQWREPADSELPGPVVTEQVTSLTVGRNDEVLTNHVPPHPRGSGTGIVSTFRHDFADTRHRRVTYTLTAVSRHRTLFDPAPDADFQSSTVLPAVSIPSSARPSPPVVLSATPAFSRSVVVDSGYIQRRRGGKTVRIELARPWNVSGEGEQLAVVLAADTSPPYLDKATRHLSRLYRDPIWQTPETGGYLQPHVFGSDLAPLACTLEETEQPVAVIPFRPFLNDEADRWWADIEIPLADTEQSYSPFVRLAVARYQPESVKGCELSRTVMTDFVPLMPDRTLTVGRSGDDVTLRLNGIGPVGPRSNKVIAVVEQCLLPEGAFAEVSDVTSANETHAGLWHRDGRVVVGELNAPLPPLNVRHGTGLLRVVVREIEDIEVPLPSAPQGSIAADLQQRTVFLDVVPIF